MNRHFFIKLSDVLTIYLASSVQVIMAFIFDINTNLNENYKEMS